MIDINTLKAGDLVTGFAENSCDLDPDAVLPVQMDPITGPYVGPYVECKHGKHYLWSSHRGLRKVEEIPNTTTAQITIWGKSVTPNFCDVGEEVLADSGRKYRVVTQNGKKVWFLLNKEEPKKETYRIGDTIRVDGENQYAKDHILGFIMKSDYGCCYQVGERNDGSKTWNLCPKEEPKKKEPAPITLEVISIQIVTGSGPDDVFLELNLPSGTWPYTGNAVVKLQVAHGQGNIYCMKHFPYITDKKREVISR